MNEESRPQAALKDLGGSTLKFTATGRIRLDETLETLLGNLADDVVLGNVLLHQLPASLFTWWHYGAQSRQPEIDALQAIVARIQHECSRLWLAAFTTGERQDYLLKRLDEAFEAADEMADVDNLLAIAWSGYVESLAQVCGGAEND